MIAEAIVQHDAPQVRGFVVLHGTDTLPYSSAGVSMLLPNFCKSVVFTGAQIPLCKLRTDAKNNLLGALDAVGVSGVCEMYFDVFDDVVMCLTCVMWRCVFDV